jgi:hypothetical protein
MSNQKAHKGTFLGAPLGFLSNMVGFVGVHE